jgi:2-iminoacetate synthase ThiH
MMVYYTYHVRSMLSFEKLHPAAASDRYRHLQPNSGWSLETLMEELEEGLQALKGIGTPQEDQESQLTWILGALRV